MRLHKPCTLQDTTTKNPRQALEYIYNNLPFHGADCRI